MLCRRTWMALPFLFSAAACSDTPSGPSDQQPPQLVHLAFATGQVEAQPSGPVTAELLVTARDQTGISEVSADFDLPDGSTRGCSGTLAEGDKTDGTWRCDVTVEPGDPAGYWQIQDVLLEDEAGNSVHARLPSPPPVLHVVVEGMADLTIRFIERLPRMEWIPDSPDPSRDGWPAEGEEVQWRAHVKNWSTSTRIVDYEWYVDDVPAGSGTMTIPGDTTATASLPWSWTFDRHRIRFVLDPDNQIPETEEGNNTREVFSDALSVGFWVERSVADALRELEPQVVGAHATSFGDWAQRHVDRFNQMAADAVYPETPDGVLDRWRLDRIVFVEDGQLPSIRAPATDRTVDLMWGFDQAFAQILRGLAISGPATLNGTLLHELGHARYLVDVYATHVYHGLRGHTIELTENGASIVGQGFFPEEYQTTLMGNGETQDGWFVRAPIFQGLMDQEYSYIDRYSAAALNLIAGHRATEGNQNAPGNIGIFMDDLPADTRLRLVDEDTGAPLPGASLAFYASTSVGDANPVYGRLIDAIPELEVTADDDGIASLGRVPFDTNGGFGRVNINTSVGIVRVEHEGRVGYAFLDSTLLNLAYWRGEAGVYVRDFPVSLH